MEETGVKAPDLTRDVQYETFKGPSSAAGGPTVLLDEKKSYTRLLFSQLGLLPGDILWLNDVVNTINIQDVPTASWTTVVATNYETRLIRQVSVPRTEDVEPFLQAIKFSAWISSNITNEKLAPGFPFVYHPFRVYSEYAYTDESRKHARNLNDSGAWPSRFLFHTEMPKYGSLNECLMNVSWASANVKFALNVAFQLLWNIAVLHEHGIVHGGVCPDTVFIDAEPTPFAYHLEKGRSLYLSKYRVVLPDTFSMRLANASAKREWFYADAYEPPESKYVIYTAKKDPIAYEKGWDMWGVGLCILSALGVETGGVVQILGYSTELLQTYPGLKTDFPSLDSIPRGVFGEIEDPAASMLMTQVKKMMSANAGNRISARTALDAIYAFAEKSLQQRDSIDWTFPTSSRVVLQNDLDDAIFGMRVNGFAAFSVENKLGRL